MTSIRRRDAVASGDWLASMPPVLARVYAGRGIASPEQVELKLARLLPPDTLGQLDVATALLETAIREDRHIVIVGDFDCERRTSRQPCFCS